MIGYIKGKVIGSDSGVVILENNGIGYEIVCSGALFAKLVTDGAGEAYTYLQVREDGLTLFGFVSVAEKNMFLKLVTVSGVGPKMGIAILSQLNLNEVAIAIATSDLKRLSAVNGGTHCSGTARKGRRGGTGRICQRFGKRTARIRNGRRRGRRGRTDVFGLYARGERKSR